MEMTTLYKEDVSSAAWVYITSDLGLPDDTDEICIKHISHITESDRQKKKELQDASDNNGA
jgi:hypothetical protein